MIGERNRGSAGAGPAAYPVVLTPGLGDDAASWGTLADELAADRPCVAVDHPVLGEDVSIAGMSRAVRADVIRRAPRPVILIGCSMGAAICQEWVLEHPGDIAALVLIGGWAGPDPLLDLVLGHWNALAEAGEGELLGESGALLTFSAAYLHEHPEAARECEITDLRSYAAMAQACRRHDTRARLHQIAVPTLVINGELDRLVCRDASEELARLIPGARSVTVAAGHVPHWEQPGEMLVAIRAFLHDIGQ